MCSRGRSWGGGPWISRSCCGNAGKAAREQLTLVRVFEELRRRGYKGGYDAVRRYARRWSTARGQSAAAAYVPLSFAPGEAYQFDWSHEIVLLRGVTMVVKVAHMRLCHSRMPFVRAYPREMQEMVFDGRSRSSRAPAGAASTRQHEDGGGGDSGRQETALQSSLLADVQPLPGRIVEPVACTPASGWEKGQVENQVGLVRERFFTPRLRFKSYEELNSWLLDQCITYAKAHRHPELGEQTIWEVFETERSKLVPYQDPEKLRE